MNSSVFSLLLVLATHVAVSYSQVRSPDPAQAAQVRDLTSDVNVMYIAVQPGYEDLRVLAYYRNALGARVRTVFVTNGEAGEADTESLYPSQLAGRLRLEGNAAHEALGGEAYFLNMPDIAAASDSTHIRAAWPADSLREKLEWQIFEFKPDLILVGADRVFGPGLRSSVIQQDVLAAAAASAARSLAPWRVQRIAVEVAAGGLPIPVSKIDPLSSVSYQSMGEEPGRAYRTIQFQRGRWFSVGNPLYKVTRPGRFAAKSLDAGLPVSSPPQIRKLETGIQAFAGKYTRSAGKDELLKELLGLMDNIDLRVINVPSSEHLERRRLLRWKAGLDNIRNTLLGVRVQYDLSDTILTERQVTFLNINSIEGLSEGGTTELFVPAVESGWILNENTERRVEFTAPKEFRLLSPSPLDLNHPQSEYGLFHPVVRRPSYFFILHKAKDRERSFVYRADMRLRHAPRFLVEALIPIVKAVPGERVVVRLTNESRDGVRDSVYVRDSLAFAPGRMFRLNNKGASQVDTLFPVWSEEMNEGSHVLPIEIAGLPVARFVARKMDVRVENATRVATLPATENSPLLEALRRLGIGATVLDSIGEAPSVEKFDVVMIDRRALSLGQSAIKHSALDEFVRRGGHLVVLAQDPGALAGFPLLSGVTARPSFKFDELYPVRIDSTHSMLNVPNRIEEEDFDGWVFRKAYSSLSAKEGFEIPVRGRSLSEPLLVTRKVGSGRITYTELALPYQWMNIHGGALKLLANLASAK